jgi:energy-coupling factor transporter ATP-binding protein EcfA2
MPGCCGAAFADLDTQLVIVTHDLDLVDDVDRVIVLEQGRWWPTMHPPRRWPSTGG